MENANQGKKDVRLGFWTKKTHAGVDFLSGSLNDQTRALLEAFLADTKGKKVRMSIFKNDYKKEEKHPDWNLILSEMPPQVEAPSVIPDLPMPA